LTSSITKKVLSSLSVAALALTALTATSIPASAAAETKTITVAGFASNSTSLTQAMRTRINKFVNNNKDYGFITCVGFADRPGSKTSNNSLGQGRALAGCNQAVRANSDLSISGTRGKWDNTSAGSDVRRVKITLSKTAFANITTSFNYRGGEGAVTSLKSAIGDTITLPTATREGYQLVGWFTKRKGGVSVGIAEGFHNPTKSRTLFARWVVGDAPEQAPVLPSTISTVCQGDIPFEYNPNTVTPATIGTELIPVNGFAIRELTAVQDVYIFRADSPGPGNENGVCLVRGDSEPGQSGWQIGEDILSSGGSDLSTIGWALTAGRKYFIIVYSANDGNGGFNPRNIGDVTLTITIGNPN
jgi:hypothetical protein